MTAIVVKATVILLVTLTAVRLSARGSAAVRHLLLAAGFAMLLALPLAALVAPSVPVPVAPMPLAVDELVREPIFGDEPGVAAVAASVAEPATVGPTWNLSRTEALTVAWAGGVLLCGIPLLIGLFQVGRVRRTALPWIDGQRLVDALAAEAGRRRRVDVLLHESIAAPATCGIVRHTILFPVDVRSWSEADVLRAAVHEVEHVRRADCLVHLLARLVCAAYWFHPLVWIAWRRMSLEAERACDDAVLRRAEATGYADQLVTLAGRLSRHARQPLLAMANRSDLVRRVAAVLDPRQARGDAGAPVAAAVALAACALVSTISPLTAVTATAARSAANTQAGAADTAPRFEVATVRINRSGDLRARHSAIPAAGQLTITNVTVRELIEDAYDVQPMMIVNMSDWARSQRVDVVAKAAAPAPVAALQRMLQPLLAEHFKLSVRRESREMDALALSVANEGRRGPGLQKTSEACDDAVGTSSGFARAAESADQRTPCGILPGGAGRIVARGLDMPGLADLLAPSQRRPVLDRTGLAGRFDVDLTYTPDAFSAAALAQRAGATLPSGVDPNGPPLATALREQLGLTLEPVRATVEVLVIERGEPLAAASPGAQGAAPAPARQFELASLRFSASGRPGSRVTQAAAAQSAPAFEVVSIRRNESRTEAPTTRVEGGRFVASNVALQQLISDAYRMPVTGGPEWIRDPPGPPRAGEVRFDVIATIPPDTPAAQIPLMVRTLLARRFGLAVHTETRETPAYLLVHAREDRRLGPRLLPSTQQCQSEIDAGPLRAPVRRVTEDGKPVCSIMMGPAAIRGGGLTMRFLANTLGGFVGRVVVDRTGLTGPFDFELTYAPPARGTPPPPSEDRPSIFTAVQEQLGLELEPSVAPVEFLVVDTVSMPTEN
jgi:uncharacterized protein (TIGR03435 family)